MLTDEQINEIVREAARGSATRRDGSTSMRIARAVEAAVLEAQGKQEPVAWVYYPKGVGEKYFTLTNPASLDLGKNAGWIAHIQPLYAAPVALPHNGIASTPEQVDEIVDAICAKVVRPDMVLVPREPTEAMLEVMAKLQFHAPQERYRAMIAAAEKEQ